MASTDQYEGMVAETVTVTGHGGDVVHAYYARPTGPGPFPGVVVLHHMPGWDEWYKEATRRFAYHGYAAVAPDLYCRSGHGTPEDVAAMVRGAGGVPDDQVAVHEKELQRLSKNYEFHMYPGAGHGFFYHDRPAAYRAEQAVDGWKKVFDLFGRTLG